MTKSQLRFKRDVSDKESILWQRLYDAAMKAGPTPIESGFKVWIAGLNTLQFFSSGANHEYRLGRGIHAEESLVANLPVLEGFPAKLERILIVTDTTTPTWPCGNCRDVLREYCIEDAVVASVPQKTRKVHIRPLTDFYFEHFVRAHKAHKISDAQNTPMFAAKQACKNSYSIYVPQEKQHELYGAAFLTDAGIFAAGFEGDAAFHPGLPIENAGRMLINGSEDPKRFNIQQLYIYARGKTLNVQYRDRQFLYEFAARFCKTSIPIVLVAGNEGTKKGREKLYFTNSKDWLPLAFGPQDLGLANELREHSKLLRGRRE